MVRLEAQGPLIGGDGFVQLTLLLERHAEIIVCLHILRVKAQRLVIGGDGLIKFSLLFEGIA